MRHGVLGRVAGKIIKFLPGPVLFPFARPFMAGRSVKEAIAWAEYMQARCFSVTLDPVGEDARDSGGVTDALLLSIMTLEGIARIQAPADVAVKLSNFGFFYRYKRGIASDPQLYESGINALQKLCGKADKLGVRIWIDAETLASRKLTWEVLRSLPIAPKNLGVCIQAYAFDAVSFLKSQIGAGWTGAIRVCMGAAYPGDIKIISDNVQWEDTFFSLCEAAADGGCLVQVATHRSRLQERCTMLLRGVPHESGLLKGKEPKLACALRDTGERVVIYGPFGSLKKMKGYTARRVEENPDHLFLPFQQFHRGDLYALCGVV